MEPTISDKINETNAKPHSKNFFVHVGKRRLLLATIPLVIFLMAGGFAFVHINKQSDQALKASAKEQTSKAASGKNSVGTTQYLSTKNSASTINSSETNSASPSGGGTATGISSGSTSPSTGSTSPTPPSPPPSGGTTAIAPRSYDINYTNDCYGPANMTIKKADTIKFKNNSTRNMWPASDSHPSHTIYSEFDAGGSVIPGNTYSFTFNKSGSWAYHDHLKPSCSGVITVQ